MQKTACVFPTKNHILSLNRQKDFLNVLKNIPEQKKVSNIEKQRRTTMSNRSSNRAAVPEAKSALDRFKYEVAGEIGVPLKDGYNGDLTSRQNGSVGGYMVKKMIEAQEQQMSGK